MRFIEPTSLPTDPSVLKDIVAISPPALVSSTVFLGLTLSDWVYVGTIIYTIIGITTMIKKHWVDPYLAAKKVKNVRQRDNPGDDSGAHVREDARGPEEPRKENP